MRRAFFDARVIGYGHFLRYVTEHVAPNALSDRQAEPLDRVTGFAPIVQVVWVVSVGARVWLGVLEVSAAFPG